MNRLLAMQSEILNPGSPARGTPIPRPANAPMTAERVLGIVLWVALFVVVIGVGSMG